MNELSQFLVESILSEADGVENKVVVYAGRFQPFHKGHYATYSHLVKKFGKDNVFIGTSNKTDNKKSPFNFKEKVMIMNTMFGISKNRIVEVKNPYVPIEVLRKFDKDNTAFVTVVGKKDASRLGGKFFTPYKDNLDFEGYEDRGYVYIAPQQSNPISGTDVRNNLKSGSDEEKKKFFTKRAYPKFNQKIFDFIVDKLSKLPEVRYEDISIPKRVVEEWLRIEGSNLIENTFNQGRDGVDDGPNYLYPSFAAFDASARKRAEQIGWEVVRQIMSDDLVDIDPHPIYPNGPVKAVTPYPAGVLGKTTATNQKDFETAEAYDKWMRHISKAIEASGFSLINFFLNFEDETEGDENYTDNDLLDKGANFVSEDINLPVKVGDTILTGRFKNKKTVVKAIGKDEHGMPTINGRKVVNFRILKEGVEVELNEFGGVRFDLVGYDSNDKSVLKTIKRASDSFMKDVVKYGTEKLFKSGKGVEYVKIYYDKNHLMTVTDGGKKQFKEKGWGKLPINEIPMADLIKIDQYADKQLKPVDVVLTDKHFFDRLQDPRNKKDISQAELIGFFKRLGKRKKDFVNFLNQYNQVVAKDNRSKINIPFMKQANKIIAKTVMRKDDFKTSSPEYKFESLPTKTTDKFKAVNLDPNQSELEKDFNKHHQTSAIAKRGSLAEPDTIDFDDDDKNGGYQSNEKDTKKRGYEPVTEQLAKGMDIYDIANMHKVDIDDLNVELQKGIEVEKEHTPDRGEAERIALDHLYEDPKYYTKLATIEEVHMGYPDQKWLDDHEKELKRLRQSFDKEKKDLNFDKSYAIQESLLTEGGAYGHMNHPFDTEINLTFGQLKDIVNKALEGNLQLAREKTDGQALAVSWRDGRLVAARNKGHLKNKGENALDINGVAMKFAGRGELEKAYNFAMKDLSKAISKLSEKQREKIFKGGACFMNLEVIYPTSVNVIPYGQALLVFHGTMEYNDAGVAIGENQEAARILAGMIKQVNAEVQSAYTIQGPPINELPKSKDLTKLKGKYNSKISNLQSKFKLKDGDGIGEYHQAFWIDFINKKSPTKLDNRTLMGLVKRWAFYNKTFRLDKKNLPDEKTLEWAKGIDKNDHAKMAKDNIRPFEDIFLGIGADILSFMSSVLAANPEQAVRDMKKRLDQTIKDVKKSGDVKKIAKLKLELERLNAIGGKDKIVPNEGIVFVYGGKTFKLTGTFAPLNQILGLFYE